MSDADSRDHVPPNELDQLICQAGVDHRQAAYHPLDQVVGLDQIEIVSEFRLLRPTLHRESLSFDPDSAL